MFQFWRLKHTHTKYLESCRNLKEGRDYWLRSRSMAHRILEALSPVPLLGLHEDGARMLAALTELEVSCKHSRLKVDTLRKFHCVILAPGRPGAGEYRKGQASVIESKIQRPAFQKVPALMMQLEAMLSRGQERFDQQSSIPLEPLLMFALEVHTRIAFIHPFADGNGRVARLGLNYLLRRYSHGYVILPPLSESPEHFQALEEAHGGNLTPFIELARCSMVRV